MKEYDLIGILYRRIFFFASLLSNTVRNFNQKEKKKKKNEVFEQSVHSSGRCPKRSSVKIICSSIIELV